MNFSPKRLCAREGSVLAIAFSPSEIRTYVSAIDFWVEKETAQVAAIVLAVFGSIIVFSAELSLLIQVATPFAVAIVVMFIWFIGREAYFRSGRSRKIGIAYEGLNVGLVEWIKLKKELYALFSTDTLSRNISLRRVPIFKVKTDDQWQSVARRYGFTIIFKASHSSSVDPKEPAIWEFKQHLRFRAQIDQQFLSVLRNVFSSQLGFTGRSDLQRLEHQVRGQFETLILHTGYICFAERDYATAPVLFKTLDDVLKKRALSQSSEARKDLRRLMALCAISDSFYPGDSPPLAEDLVDAITKCNVALKDFGGDFPDFLNVQARNLCYAFRYQAAIECIDRLINQYDATAGRFYWNAVLNKGVLLLLLNDNKNATECFRTFWQSCGFEGYDLPELIKFADFSDGYHSESSIFLRVWYRKAAGNAVDKDLNDKLFEWLHKRPYANKYIDLIKAVDRLQKQKKRRR